MLKSLYWCIVCLLKLVRQWTKRSNLNKISLERQIKMWDKIHTYMCMSERMRVCEEETRWTAGVCVCMVNLWFRVTASPSQPLTELSWSGGLVDRPVFPAHSEPFTGSCNISHRAFLALLCLFRWHRGSYLLAMGSAVSWKWFLIINLKAVQESLV